MHFVHLLPAPPCWCYCSYDLDMFLNFPESSFSFQSGYNNAFLVARALYVCKAPSTILGTEIHSKNSNYNYYHCTDVCIIHLINLGWRERLAWDHGILYSMVWKFFCLNHTQAERNFHSKVIFLIWHLRIELPSHLETVLIVCLNLGLLHLALVNILLTGPWASIHPSLSTVRMIFLRNKYVDLMRW